MALLGSMKRAVKQGLGTNNYYRLVVLWHRLNGRTKNLNEQTQDWKVYQDDPRMDPILKNMLLSCESGQKETLISNYWKELINRNVGQLMDSGFENFKQTVALNYFTWFPEEENNPQIKFLKDNLPAQVLASAKAEAESSPKHSFFNTDQSALYNFVTLLFWEYVQQQGAKDLLKKLDEPLLGNPPALQIEVKWFSQDLANSILEYQSILKGIGDFSNVRTILEIGAGYGRTSYVVLKLNPKIRYIIADIPPALYIAQRYLSEVFKDRKVFMYRDFDDFAQVEKEFMSADIIFLMPSQLEKIPSKAVDLCVAIDCLHEMLPEKLNSYFLMIDRLAHHLYFKCWKKTTLPFDQITLTQKDYPVLSHWQEKYSRECRVQTKYFESFYSWDK